MRVVVVSDTHSPRRWKACPPAVAAQLDGADVILHAGDVCRADTLDELSRWAPVHAVLGNNDGPDVAGWGAPETLEIELAGVPIAMIHDSGPAKGRAERMRRRFPSAAVVVFGHSHIPWNEQHRGQLLFNPGSPTDRRRQPHCTYLTLAVHDGRIEDLELHRLPPRTA